jgi:transcriptional regulator with GAF, ATPase, and Fis domain
VTRGDADLPDVISTSLATAVIATSASPPPFPLGARGAALDQVLAATAREAVLAFEGALARVWLVGPGDLCAGCAMLRECPDQSRCLHLVASAGLTERLDGPFRRFPIGARRVGEVAVTRRPFFARSQLQDIGLAEAGWLATHRIRSFVALPLESGGELLGILALFSRRALSAEDERRIAAGAGQAASAIDVARRWDATQARLAQLAAENLHLRESSAEARGLPPGVSPAWRRLLTAIDSIGPSDMPVLIHGEPGTGRERVARALHRASRRREAPFVRLRCAAIPHDQIHALLFGASLEGGAERLGRVEVAAGGTLYIDELGDVPVDLQPAVLRLIREGTFQRVGEAQERPIDVRVIAATGRDLAREVEAGRFDEDLLLALDAVPIRVPPLRERREDVPLLARHFATSIAREIGSHHRGFEPAFLDRLAASSWPGNLRELHNTVERALLSSKDGVLRDDQRIGTASLIAMADATGDPGEPPPPAQPLTTLADVQREAIERALAHTHGRVSGPRGAAALLGLKPTTLESRMKKLGVRRRGA